MKNVVGKIALVDELQYDNFALKTTMASEKLHRSPSSEATAVENANADKIPKTHRQQKPKKEQQSGGCFQL